MVLKVLRDLIVKSDSLGPDAMFGEDAVGLTECPDEFLSLPGLDGCCVDVVGILVVEDE